MNEDLNNLRDAAQKLQDTLGLEVEVVEQINNATFNERYLVVIKNEGFEGTPQEFVDAFVDLRGSIQVNNPEQTRQGIAIYENLRDDPEALANHRFFDTPEDVQEIIDELQDSLDNPNYLGRENFGAHLSETSTEFSQASPDGEGGYNRENATITYTSPDDLMIPVADYSIHFFERFVEAIEGGEVPEQIAAISARSPEVAVDAPDVAINIDQTPGFKFE